MGNRNKLLKSFLPLLLIVTQVSALKCNCEGFFCLNDKEYQLCRRGKTIGNPISCPGGNICRNETKNECSHQPLCRTENNFIQQNTLTKRDWGFCSIRGRFLDPSNCHRYYRCFAIGIAILITCPNNRYFSVERNRCTRMKPQRCFDEPFYCHGPGIHPDPTNCRRFYVCDRANRAFHRSCIENTYYDDIAKDCLASIPERCKNIYMTTVTAPPVTQIIIVPQSTATVAPTAAPPALPSAAPPALPSAAPPAQTASAMTASASTTTTTTTTTTPRVEVTSSTVQTVINKETTPFIDNITKQVPDPNSPNAFVCPGDGAFEDPEDCHNYYICGVLPVPIRAVCPGGTYYDRYYCLQKLPDRCRKRGNSIYKAPIELSEASTTEVLSTTNISTGTEEQTTEGTTSTSITEEPSTITPSEGMEQSTDVIMPILSEFACPGDGIFAHPQDCRKYYICGMIDKPFRVTCPRGTYYDKFFCSNELPDRCNQEMSESKTPEVTAIDKIPATIPTEDIGPNVDGLESSPDEFLCPADGAFEDPEDCHKYYICGAIDRPLRVTCPMDTFYDNYSCYLEMPERCRARGNLLFLLPDEDTEDSTTEGTSTTSMSTGYEGSTTEGTTSTSVTEESSTNISTMDDEQIAEGTTSTSITEEMSTDNIDGNIAKGTEMLFVPDKFFCPGDGIFPDPEDCRHYYICGAADGLVRMACPEGTYYHKYFCIKDMPERCRARGNTLYMLPVDQKEQENLAGICDSEGLFPDPQNCQRYYICNSFGDAMYMACPRGTYYNEKTTLCSSEMPAKCSESGKPSITQNDDKNPNGKKGVIAKLNPQFECPGEGYFGDKKNCRKYYACFSNGASFIGVPVVCPEGTYFDEVNGVCSPKIPDRCSDRSNPSMENSRDLNEDLSCTRDGYFANPKDCSRYYVCDGQSIMQFVCPSGTYFNVESDICDEERPERCLTSEDHNEYSTSPSYSNYPTTVKDTVTFSCPGEGNFPDPENCQKYFICHNQNSPIPVTCPKYTYFDEDYGYCMKKKPLRCRRIGKPSVNQVSTTPSPSTEQEISCNGKGFYPDPKDCRNYYMCLENNQYVLLSCPENTFYDGDTTYCTPDKPKGCQNTFDKDFTCPDEGYFADPLDCHSYYLCYSRELSKHVRCPENTYYDKNFKGCSTVRPDTCKNQGNEPNFDCPQAGFFPNPNDCKSYFVCNSSGDYFLKKCPEDKNFDEDTSECTSTEPPRCKSLTQLPQKGFTCTSAGYHPDPNNCSLYHYCNPSGHHYTSSCPPKTYYHEDTRKCSSSIPDRCIYLGHAKLISNDISNGLKSMLGETGALVNVSFSCPGKGLFPDPNDCRRFFVCYGQPRAVTCRHGLYFNEEIQECGSTLPETCKTKELTSPNGASLSTEFVCPGKGFFAHPTNCHKFYICYGEPREITCWGDAYYNEETESCIEAMPDRCKSTGNQDAVLPESVDSNQDANINGSKEFKCERPGAFPDPSDCKKFYQCSLSLKMRHKICKGNTYFNEIFRSCSFHPTDRCKNLALPW